MMRFLPAILLLACLNLYGQKTYVIPADSTKLTSVNGTGNELIIENDTKDSLGVLANSGSGRTSFKNLRLQQLTDTTFRLLLGTTAQGQTITIPVSSYGGGGSSGRKVDTIYRENGSDSIMFTINGVRYSIKDSFENGVLLLDTAEVDYFTVINTLNTPPGGPATGATYTVGTSPTGAWVGQANSIAEWNGASWDFTAPTQGDYYYNQTNGYTFQFRSGAWVRTSSIPVLVNGQSLSSGVRLGTNNARSLTFESNNVARGRLDSIGRWHFYNVGTASSADTFVTTLDALGKVTRVGKSTFLAGVSGGGSGANIYNSNGSVPIDTVRYADLNAGSAIVWQDSSSNNVYTYWSMNGTVLPVPGGGYNFIPGDGTYAYNYYVSNDLSELFGGSKSVYQNGSILSTAQQITDYNTSAYEGFAVVHPKGTQEIFSRWYHKLPNGESLWMTLQDNNNRGGFYITPYEYGNDTLDPWTHEWTFRIDKYLSSASLLFGTKTAGDIYMNIPQDDAVSYVVGWDSADSTLKRIDKSTLGGGGSCDVCLLSTKTPTSGEVEFALPEGYGSFEIRFNDVLVTAGGSINIVISEDSSTYITSGVYHSVIKNFYIDSSAAAFTPASESSNTLNGGGSIFFATGTSEYNAASGFIRIENPRSSGTVYRQFAGEINNATYNGGDPAFSDPLYLYKTIGTGFVRSTPVKMVRLGGYLEAGTFKLYGYK